MVIRISEIVPTPSTYEDGEKIFRLLLPALQRGELINVSFEEIGSVPSAFVNAAFVRLLESLPFSKIQEQLTFTNTTRNINALIKSRFAFANRVAAPEKPTP